jgi:hypothetical protein
VAQKIQILLIDDLDGSAAEGTVRFGLDGAEHEIDLNAGHDRELRDALTRYVNAARRAGSSARKLARSSRGPGSGLNTHPDREWARAQSIEAKARGRVPVGLVAQTKAATGQQGWDVHARARLWHLTHMPNIVRGRPRIVMPRPIAMHAPCDQLRRVLQLYSFPEITRNAEYERLPGPHLQHRGRHRYPSCCSGPCE